MTGKRNWFQRPLAACCLLAAVTILSVYIIASPGEQREGGEEISYRVTIRHYGCDAREMETSAAIPLEDALSAIPGINRIVTVSENGRVRAFANFRRERFAFSGREDEYYDAVREAAQRVYETLPSSAQRPELSSAGYFRVPFWTAAVYDSSGTAAPGGDVLERIIKPVLSSIEGVGEVEIAGPGTKEIIILPDPEKSAALGLSPARISAVIASNDALFAGGSINYNGLEIPIRVDGRYSDPRSLGDALIPLDSPNVPGGGFVRLGAIAGIREEEREPDIISRLNGKKTAIISLTAVSGADTRLLSNRIKKEMEKFSSLPLELRVLEDRGAEESAAFRSVLIAALEASVLVAIGTILMGLGRSAGSSPNGGLRNAIICSLAIPLILVISAAVLSGAGFPVNRKFLTGLAVGSGGAVDAVILSAEGFGRARDSREGGSILRRIFSPLISGVATTVAALLPLLGISAAGDIKVIAYALGAVTMVSVVLALTLLPPLFLWEQHTIRAERIRCERSFAAEFYRKLRVVKNLRRRFSRFFAALVRLCVNRSVVFPVLSLLVTAAAILALAVAGADTAGEWAEDSVYAQVEFEGGFLKEEGDTLLASWAEKLKEEPAVREVQTGARVGGAYALVTFDPAKTDIAGIRKLIRSGAIPGAFIYIPEPSPGDRIWNISVSGDDADKCRELVREAASRCSVLPVVKETVLNFKQGGPRLTLVPRRELLARDGINFSFPADTVRRGVYGPVIYKRTGDGRETDVRVKFSPSRTNSEMLDGEDVLRIPLAVGNTTERVRAGSLMEAMRTPDVSAIQRENRRRIASFSVRTNPGDPRLFRDRIMDSLKTMELPPGYRLDFDPEAISGAEALSRKFLNFIWAVLFCYMIIAAAEESFLLPLIILSSVPPSLAIPVLVLAFSGAPINTAAACALVAVSGMTVNASVISAGELWRHFRGESISVYRSLRKRITVLLATTGTTLAGTFPFLLLREGNNAFIRTLALVTVLGVGVSFICSLTLVPSLMNLYFRIRVRRNSGSALTGLNMKEGVSDGH